MWWTFACADPTRESAPPPAPTETSGPEETGPGPIVDDDDCDGVDDDGDGHTDEDAPADDRDGDGVRDCRDPCVLVPAPPTVAPIRADCFTGSAPPPDDPWSPSPLWSWTGLSDALEVRHTVSTPVVVPIDGGSAVFVVATDDEEGWLVRIDGPTGATRWANAGAAPEAGLTAADLDGDDLPEIVFVAADHHLAAVDLDGAPRWTSELALGSPYAQPVAADLDGDGRDEVVTDDGAVDREGGVLFWLDDPPTYGAPLVHDADGDGAPEIYLGARVWSADGSPLWEAEAPGTDGDWWVPVAEGIARVANGVLTVHDPSGAPLVTVDASFPGVGAPAVADLDGDLQPDVVWIGGSELVAWRTTGEPLWGALVTDRSGLAAVSAWDVDADGVHEVLVADEDAFLIVDGRTGDERFRDVGRGSGTVFESPAVADLDGDGHGEIVVPSDGRQGGTGGVTAWSQAGWPAAGPAWTGHAPGAESPGHYRSRPAEDGQLDLVGSLVVVTESCVEDDGTPRTHVQVGNEGRAAGDVVIEVGAVPLSWTLDPGEAAAGVIVEASGPVVVTSSTCP